MWPLQRIETFQDFTRLVGYRPRCRSDTMRSQGVGHFSEVLVDIGISGQRTITLDVVAVTEIQDLVDCATEKCLGRARRQETSLAKCTKNGRDSCRERVCR